MIYLFIFVIKFFLLTYLDECESIVYNPVTQTREHAIDCDDGSLKNNFFQFFLTKGDTIMFETSIDFTIEFDLRVHEDEIFGESRGGVLASHTYEQTLSKHDG